MPLFHLRYLPIFLADCVSLYSHHLRLRFSIPISITLLINSPVASALPILGRFNKASTASLGRFKLNLSQAWGDHNDKQYSNGRQETHWPPTVVVVIKHENVPFARELSYSPRKPTWPTLPSVTRTHSAFHATTRRQWRT